MKLENKDPCCISQEEIEALLKSNKKVVIVDVRDAKDYEEKHIPTAIHIPLANILKLLNQADSETLVCTACGKGGGRSTEAANLLRENGIANTKWICGGTLGWK